VIERADVEAAARRLEGVANRTPVFTSRTLNERVGAEVFLKAESLQRGGAFKFRGAYNAVSQVDGDVAAYSSGNHAQAVAIAARLTGKRAVIVMPEDTPAAKLEATRGYGAEIVTYDRYTQDREQLGRALAEERGLSLVPPYDHPLVMAGQGTAALELLDQVGPLDAVVVPVGGGGLIAGTATAVDGRARVFGVEPEAGDDTRRSLEAGERVCIDVPRTIADGLQATAPGELTFEVNRERVDGVVTVTDAEIVEAMAFLFDRMKLVVEPSGAVGVAALLQGRIPAEGRIGVILSGGNVGVERFLTLFQPERGRPQADPKGSGRPSAEGRHTSL
jgi:threo-3-hydroxy-L-aspartate ammonia-lyase